MNNIPFSCTHPNGFAGSLHHGHDDRCCHIVPPTYNDDYYTTGYMNETAFVLSSSVPYVVDKTDITYGPRISVSEQVCTRVAQRNSLSCLNLDAKFDMTSTIETNTTLNHYITQIISNTNADLNGILPVIKQGITFKLYYTIRDSFDDIVTTSFASVKSKQVHYVATDVRDFYLTMDKDIIVTNFDDINYEGMYKLTLDKIEAYCDVIDVSKHIVDNLNPYYQFSEDDSKIITQHDTIEAVEPDESILIATCDINYQVPFQANITTCMKISFIAYMSMLISTRNTFNIWNAMNDTTKNMIDKLALTVANLDTRVSTLEQEIGDMVDTTVSSKLTELSASITELNTELTRISSDYTTTDTSLHSAITDNTKAITALDTRVTSLETTPIVTTPVTEPEA